MRLTKIIAVMVLISLAAMPAVAQLSDYQKGVHDGIKMGFNMGSAYQAFNDGKANSQQYNQAVSYFNSFVQAAFAGNQTAINEYLMSSQQQQSQATQIGKGYQAYPSLNARPIHAIDASWNQTAQYNPDVKGTVYGYDPDTYYTMVGWQNSGLPNAPRDANGNVIDSNLLPP